MVEAPENNLKNKTFLKRAIGLGIVIDLIIFDQISKWLILENVFSPKIDTDPLGLFGWIASSFRLPFASVEVFSFFNLTLVWNEGISFGLFQSGNPWPLTIISLTIATIFSVWLWRSKNWVEVISLAMVIGGALGNVIDRLHFSAVADFLDFHAFGWHFPAFNLADSFISIGIVILIANSLFCNSDNKEVH